MSPSAAPIASNLYRAIDAHGQVIDVVLRTHRDLASARACFIPATYRRRTMPEEVITDKHPAYIRAIREEVSGAIHTQSGLHRKNGPDTRPMRGLQSIRTAQRAIKGIAPARAVRRGHVAAPDRPSAGDAGHHA